MDYSSINARIAEFDAKHGASVYADGWLYFEDGASRESNPLGSLNEPPEDPYRLAKRRLFFHEFLLARAVRAFEQRKHYIMAACAGNLRQARCGPAPVDAASAEAELKQLRHSVLAYKRLRDQAAAAADAVDPRAGYAEMDAECRASNQDLLARVNSIEV